MKNYQLKTQRGFTLIEILLYMGLATIMVVLIGGIGVNVFSGYVKAKAAEELQYSTHFLTERLRTVVSQAAAIDAPSAGGESSILVLEVADVAKNPTVIDIVDGRLRITEGAEEPQFISGSRVLINEAAFFNATYADGVGSLRIVFEVGLRNPEDRTIYFSSSTIHTTINLQYP